MFHPPHSTENHLRAALLRTGHEVTSLQENETLTWEAFDLHLAASRPDLILWTRTGWDWEACCGWKHEEAKDRQWAMLNAARRAGAPTVGYHLDRWWGLDREGQVREEPFFAVDALFTADGGHDDHWRAAGINHRWLPPGVLQAECERQADPRAVRSYRGVDVAFVGSWRLAPRDDGGWDGYHDEWAPQRKAMLDACRSVFGHRFRCYPQGRALRGPALSDLYGHVPVIVGDSCLAGGISGYWSDRIPETLGRGGVLVHPHVDGLESHFTPGEHLVTYPQGDWTTMVAAVQSLLGDAEWRARIRKTAREHVLDHHTYEVRMGQVIDACRTEGLLP